MVDDLRTPGVPREQMRACLQALVDGLPAGDFVALVPTSGDRRAAREFTRDRRIVREAIEALLMPPPRQDLWSADNLLISSIGNAAMMLGRAGAPRGTLVLLSHGMAVALSDDYRRSLTAKGGGTLHVIDPTGRLR